MTRTRWKVEEGAVTRRKGAEVRRVDNRKRLKSSLVKVEKEKEEEREEKEEKSVVKVRVKEESEFEELEMREGGGHGGLGGREWAVR